MKTKIVYQWKEKRRDRISFLGASTSKRFRFQISYHYCTDLYHWPHGLYTISITYVFRYNGDSAFYFLIRICYCVIIAIFE